MNIIGDKNKSYLIISNRLGTEGLEPSHLSLGNGF